ncbi:MAG: hypothetical protein SNJ70_03675, partial [Armatimonadota bacterium]
MKKIIIECIIIILISSNFASANNKLSYVDLINRMIDLEHISLLPEDGERAEQWSSYDRASQYDPETEKYINWDANQDGDGFIREENGKQVIAEMEGPGCIWRIWSAYPSEGKVSIYLDDNPIPVLDMPFRKYFINDTFPFNLDQIAYIAALGHNLYLPIPYQKSCKIVGEAR